MESTPAGFVDKLRLEGAKTTDFFRDLPAHAWHVPVYTDGAQWTAHELLTHIVSTEIAIQSLMRDIMEGGSGSPPDFDIDLFTQDQVDRLGTSSNSDLLQEFQRQRAASIELVGQMQAEDLSRQGRHPFLGIAPFEDIIKLLYRHVQIHQRDIRKNIQSSALL